MIPLPDSELLALLHALCEDDLTETQAARLDSLLASSPEAVAQYVGFMQQQADLGRHFGQPRLPFALPKPVPRRSGRAIRALMVLGGLAALLLIAWALRPGGMTSAEATDAGIAVLSQAAEAEWAGPAPRTGASLPPGTLHLRAGLAQVQSYNGATLLMEGPAEIDLIAPDHVRCRAGRFQAMVPPPAVGFTVDVPGARLVDRGTEFGLDIGTDRSTEVHVFQGQVEAYGPAPRAVVAAGQAVRIAADGTTERIALARDRFASVEQLADRSRTERDRRQQDWLDASRRLAAGPGLTAFYGFEQGPARPTVLPDLARPGMGDGTIIGARGAEGRWPGKHALELQRVGDRIRIDVPGSFDSLGLAAWVRVDALPHRLNAMLMADGYPAGALHWQINADGAVVLGIQDATLRQGTNYTTPTMFSPDRLGQWTHLAVVVDGPGHQVSHYVDGQLVYRLGTRFTVPLRIGPAEIGNWSPAGFADARPVRNLIGRIDELVIFSRPLTDAEVHDRYVQGHP